MVKFGPAGQEDAFSANHKSVLEMPAYLAERGLTAFEYQCGHGVRIGEKTARALGEKAREYGISLSLHAPYFISLSSGEEEKRQNSLGYIRQAAQALDWMGGERMVIHSGSVGKGPRGDALARALQTLAEAQRMLDDEGFSHLRLCPETMGKLGQLGDLAEVLTLCGVDERFIPCVDFGHLNARTCGGVNDYDAMAAVLDALENALGRERAASFHSHFSKIEYSSKGEVRHLTFEDETFGPGFDPLARLLFERKMTPTIICESAGTQARDAAEMQNIYRAQKGES